MQRCAGGARVGLKEGWAAVLLGPGPTVLDLGLSPFKTAITTSKGQPRDALKLFGHKSIYSGPR